MSGWKRFPYDVPSDGDVCTIRLAAQCVDFPATWSSAGSCFTVSGLTAVPWYLVSVWKRV